MAPKEMQARAQKEMPARAQKCHFASSEIAFLHYYFSLLGWFVRACLVTSFRSFSCCAVFAQVTSLPDFLLQSQLIRMLQTTEMIKVVIFLGVYSMVRLDLAALLLQG